MDYDNILNEVGGRGKYQLTRYMLLAAIPIAGSWHLVGNTLLTASPAHKCIPTNVIDTQNVEENTKGTVVRKYRLNLD